MIPLAWNWLRKNVSLVLLLTATICLALAVGEIMRGSTWSLLVPVSLVAVVSGWGVGASRLSSKQAWVRLIALGIPGVFVFVGGLIPPLGRLILSLSALIPQFFAWLSTRLPIDTGSLLVAWSELIGHVASLFIRLWDWWWALLTGGPLVDPLAAGLMWSVLLWLVGAWAGWHLRRNYQALRALAPGGVIMAVVLDTRHEDVGILIVYLAALLALIGLSRVNWMHLRWRQQQVSYSDSVRLETLGMVGVVTIALVLSAAGAPSLSWREWWEKVREKDRATETGDFEPLDNVANSAAYRSGGLPRSHLLSASPELLQEVVMTVSTGELPPIPETVLDIDPNRYYWRAITYDVYSGLGWDSSAAQDISLPPNTPLLASPPAYRVLTQHIKQTQSSTKLYWTGILAQVDTEINIAWRTRPSSDPDTLQYGDMLGALSDSDEYTVESYVPEFSAEQLQSAGSDYPPEIVGRYLQLPDTTPERVIALARELTQAAPTPYDRAAAIEAYLRTFPYTLEVEPPPPGRDVVDYFLFTARQGYCDYYATSMVVLARAVGLPARLVIGYASGDYNAPTAEYIVRQEDAHSWVEIYFVGFGWVEFEPTASQAAIDRGGDVNAYAPPPGLPGGSSAFSWLMDQWRSLISSLGGQILVVGLGFILFLTLWQAGEFSYLNLISSRRAISRMYTRLERAALYLLPDLPDGHTPHQLGMALELKLKGTNHRLLKSVFSNAGNEVEQVISLFVSQVFSGHPPSNAQTRAGIRAWMLLRWRLWVAKRWI